MNIPVFFTAILTLTVTACTTPAQITVDYDNQPQPRSSGVKFGSVSSTVPKALGIKGKRALIAGIGKDGKFTLFAIDGSKFVFTDKKPKGNLISSFRIDVYKDSPECSHIDFGDGFSVWYPEDCPHP